MVYNTKSSQIVLSVNDSVFSEKKWYLVAILWLCMPQRRNPLYWNMSSCMYIFEGGKMSHPFKLRNNLPFTYGLKVYSHRRNFSEQAGDNQIQLFLLPFGCCKRNDCESTNWSVWKSTICVDLSPQIISIWLKAHKGVFGCYNLDVRHLVGVHGLISKP